MADVALKARSLHESKQEIQIARTKGLESSLLLLKAFVDLEYFCCPVWMVCWSFSVFRDGALSFSVSVLWSVFVMCDWCALLDDVD